MNRILNLFDDLAEREDCEQATNRGWGIASRFSDNKINMNTFKVVTSLDRGGSDLDLHIGYLVRGRQEWTVWHIGCQDRLTVWFEDGTRVDFDRNNYDSKRDYKVAVYNYFQEYIAHGFGNGSNLQIAQEVEFMDI
ncbi:MAG: hypothetical protein IK038_13590 [Bacteroidaceae bacterium]|nr:hypothetical protein [Bacteroidaceae bacterium]